MNESSPEQLKSKRYDYDQKTKKKQKFEEKKR